MSVSLLGHPSLSGMSSGRGDSGSVAWSNAGRIRSYLRHAQDDWQVGQPDNGKRILSSMKRSHGERDLELPLEWRDGRFYCDYQPPKADDGIGRQDKAERVFLALLRIHNNQNINVSVSVNSGSYAPKLFAAHSGRERLVRRDFVRAMEALLAAEKIVNRPIGAKWKNQFGLYISE